MEAAESGLQGLPGDCLATACVAHNHGGMAGVLGLEQLDDFGHGEGSHLEAHFSQLHLKRFLELYEERKGREEKDTFEIGKLRASDGTSPNLAEGMPPCSLPPKQAFQACGRFQKVLPWKVPREGLSLPYTVTALGGAVALFPRKKVERDWMAGPPFHSR